MTGHHHPWVRLVALLASLTLGLGGLAACGHAPNPADDGELRVVTTTGILADFVRQVAGERAQVHQLVPDGADPHAYEPSLRSIREVAYADLAFSNYLMLEQHAIIRALDANLPAGATSISIAEEAAKQGATILPLVENRGLDALWLGLRVAGDGAAYGADRASTIDVAATGVEGPGQASAYITTTFGAPEVLYSSHDGFNAATAYEDDTETLPAGAHEHVSWGFTAPGIYRVHLRASLRVNAQATPVSLGQATAVFAVGVDARNLAAAEGRVIISAGHADITADLNHSTDASAGALSPRLLLMVDEESTPEGAPTLESPGAPSAIETHLNRLSLDDVILEVPARTLTAIPAAAGYGFLGRSGQEVYVLPQAVLGKHVHGEIDPHLWHDALNAAAYVRVIRDALIAADPAGRATYTVNAARYLGELDTLDKDMSATIASIPAQRRHLVTTHDGYAYLARAYGIDVAGYITPNPGVEPSLVDRTRLAATLESLDVPAVFLEPTAARRRSPLATIAEQSGVRVCSLYGDALDARAPTYIEMMRANARSLATCLGGA